MKDRTYQLILVVVSLTALTARLHHLDAESFFMDEINQSVSYQGSILDAFLGAIRTQQPPLDYLIGYFVYQIDTSDFALRLPSALFGTASAVLITIMSARCLQILPAPRGSIAATLLLVGLVAALLPYPIYLSQDIRPYSSATFFFLLTLFFFDRLFSKPMVGWRDYLALGLATFGLLMSRTLSPLAVCLILGVLLFIYWRIPSANNSHHQPAQKRAFYAIGAMLGALCLYIPFFYRILQSGQRYLHTEQWNMLDWPFSILPDIWSAQMEPFSWFYLSLPLLGALVALKQKHQWLQAPRLVLAVLLGSSLIHFSVFHSMTALPFRPPYSIYVYPSLLILSALGFNLVIGAITARTSLILSRLCIATLTAAILTLVLSATADFKQRRLKTNWREFSDFLAQIENDRYIWITHTPATTKVWSPGLYGLHRYSSNQLKLTSISELTEDPGLLNSLKYRDEKPVLAFFIYRNYLLTSKSTIALMPAPPTTGSVPRSFPEHPALTQKSFNGLILVSLKEQLGSSHQQLIELLGVLITSHHDAPYFYRLEQILQMLLDQQETS
jgi:hypothetical protein